MPEARFFQGLFPEGFALDEGACLGSWTGPTGIGDAKNLSCSGCGIWNGQRSQEWLASTFPKSGVVGCISFPGCCWEILGTAWASSMGSCGRRDSHIEESIHRAAKSSDVPCMNSVMCRLSAFYYPMLSLAQPSAKAPLKCKISYVSLLVRDATLVRRQTLHKRATARKRLLLRAATRAFAKAKVRLSLWPNVGQKKRLKTLWLYQPATNAGPCCFRTTCWLAWWRLAVWTGCGWAVIFKDVTPGQTMLSAKCWDQVLRSGGHDWLDFWSRASQEVWGQWPGLLEGCF